MSRDAKSLTSTLALFYAIGALLAVGAYALDSIDDLAIVLTFWLRQTLTFVVLAPGPPPLEPGVVCGGQNRRSRLSGPAMPRRDGGR